MTGVLWDKEGKKKKKAKKFGFDWGFVVTGLDFHLLIFYFILFVYI